MIIHIVLFQWKEKATEEKINEVLAEIKSIKDDIPGIIDIKCGKNVSQVNNEYMHGVVVTARDNIAMEEYMVHPKQKQIINKLDKIEERSVGFDFED